MVEIQTQQRKVNGKTMSNPVCQKRQIIRSFLMVLVILVLGHNAVSQEAYFIDGYHGGVYGHYPRWKTRFIIENLNRYPEWKINLEIEPETWDSVKAYDQKAYHDFQIAMKDQTVTSRIEYVNPGYGQSYLYNISGESVIRQFTLGMQKMRNHFPGVVFTTYSSEEPCFTSALPPILKSLGYKYAVLKNPDTAWGGYTRAFGGELVNWLGPDGTKIVTVPRYACEALEPRSTWQTTAWDNSTDYIEACLEYGIAHPVGMCLQDAGWKGGPWLENTIKTFYKPSVYTTWRDYIENISIRTPEQDWRFTQEDVLVSLMWGSQVLQRIAQQVRSAENKIVMAEKLAAISRRYVGSAWPSASFDEGWRTLLLAQHHDCWIVPYNGRRGDTWADKVVRWTGATVEHSNKTMQRSISALSRNGGLQGGQYIRVFNTLGIQRNELVRLSLPENWRAPSAKVIGSDQKEALVQVVSSGTSQAKEILFSANVPATGYNTYRIEEADVADSEGARVVSQGDGTYKMDTDLYTIILDPAKGGTIKSLVAKTLDNKDFVDATDARKFNEIRGNFYKNGGFYSSTEDTAEIRVVENGPVRISVAINGTIASHPFTQLIQMSQGEKRIDFNIEIKWNGNPGIGEYEQGDDWRSNPRRGFYDDRFKLLTSFPSSLPDQKLYKNAPFDVCESKLENTFFNSWDSIKHNIILNWVDVLDGTGEYGMALLTDHTTSYAHGEDHPLSLTLQYSGKGLWGRNYTIDGPTRANYALIPHKGKWDESGIWTEGTKWNEPLVGSLMNSAPSRNDVSRSLVDVTGTGLEITSMTFEGKDLLVRLFNAESRNAVEKIVFDGKVSTVELIELDGRISGELKTQKDNLKKNFVSLSIPRFGIRTLKFKNVVAK